MVKIYKSNLNVFAIVYIFDYFRIAKLRTNIIINPRIK